MLPAPHRFPASKAPSADRMLRIAAGVAELADARDLGSRVFTTCRFDSCRPHSFSLGARHTPVLFASRAQELRLCGNRRAFLTRPCAVTGFHTGSQRLSSSEPMRIPPPSIPFHVARTYGVQTRPTVQPVTPVARQAQPGF